MDSKWTANSGVMSVIEWRFLDQVERKYHLWDTFLPKCRSRVARMALERVWAVIVFHFRSHQSVRSMFGHILHYKVDDYVPFDTTWFDYMSKPNLKLLPAVKIWAGR